MNGLQVFSNPEFGTIRTMLIDDEPWAVGKDIAEALGYVNPRKAIQDHVDDEDKGVTKCDTPGGMQNLTIINESGLYSLILSSKLPTAKRFKRWVTSEVLPTLRKTGSYALPEIATRALSPDDYLTAARILSGCRNERLPYVLPLIKKAGIEVEFATPGQIAHATGKDPETARLLTTALNDYGVSIRELERLTGIHNAQLYRMRNGTSRRNEARAAIIRDVIHALVPELDIAAVTAETE